MNQQQAEQRRQLLEFINQAINDGAWINIRFSDLKQTKSEAVVICKWFSEIVGEPVLENKDGRREHLSVRKDRIELVHRYGKNSTTIII
jgi:hypothetical protein